MSLWSVIVWFQPLLQKIQQKFELKNRPLTEGEKKLKIFLEQQLISLKRNYLEYDK